MFVLCRLCLHQPPSPGSPFPSPTAAPRRRADRRYRSHFSRTEWGDGTVLSEDGDRITVLFDEAGYRTLSLETVAGRDERYVQHGRRGRARGSGGEDVATGPAGPRDELPLSVSAPDPRVPGASAFREGCAKSERSARRTVPSGAGRGHSRTARRSRPGGHPSPSPPPSQRA
ncbi:DUF3553 domain-containing protein [Streptomyces sp. DHE17-7]|nr:DUF3553 domain-containing protein [Streptomyces sp. DHE17-7]